MISIVGKRRALMYSDVEQSLGLDRIFPPHRYWDERNINMKLRRSIENLMIRVKIAAGFKTGVIL